MDASLVAKRLFDFIRIHVTQAGGLTPCRKIAAMGEMMGVKTAWHGPGDVSPIGHAANITLDLIATSSASRKAMSSRNGEGSFSGCPRNPQWLLLHHRGARLGIEWNESRGEEVSFRLRRTRRTAEDERRLG
ncbi:MAG: enolase C-terminal domain-like protein [Paludibaculum sp.]